MRIKIIAKNKTHLLELIEQEMDSYGNRCNLNHIDTTNIINMENLFEYSPFNGKIEQWNVFNVKDMSNMFKNSLFNGDISGWNVSNVKEMNYMFENSKFNGNISEWNISNVQNMKCIFYCSQLTCDISDWTPLQVLSWESTFVSSKMPRPYWYNIPFNSRNKAINIYNLSKKLDNKLLHHEERVEPKKMKL